jgi:hypothetical protein
MTRRTFLASAAPDLRTIAPDLIVPPLTDAAPAAGLRARIRREGALHHALYLPSDWQPRRRYPVIVEYAGNGDFGDESHGLPEGSNLGYGLSGGRGFLWLCLPYVNADSTLATQWWGDPDLTTAYARRELSLVCQRHGGDPRRVLLAGFSRGAIACSYLGLRDEATSRLWRAFFTYSHFDGVKDWPYDAGNRASAIQRLRRLRHRRVFICDEHPIAGTRQFLQGAHINGRFTYLQSQFRNHNDAWLLRPSPDRQAARAWLKSAV